MMEQPDVGEQVGISSMKNDKSLFRIWEDSVVLHRGEPLVVAKKNMRVTEKNGQQQWATEGLAIGFFSQTQWYHIWLMFKNSDHYHFVAHVGSPYSYIDQKITYVDYDVSVLVTKGYQYRFVEQDEFLLNRERLHYSPEIVEQVKTASYQLEIAILTREPPFSDKSVQAWVHQYFLQKQ
ncbi:hypothetical protein [Mechercharimyces sp. CAU 1602]|uniref:hypothetical protein n=1 Tax=Mechercharimyces sp. CAU 1602 TaxID=2973933 RepID=UPI0021629E4E|nr:hypothetical protein [Mechercharimyces sp. CAU 1602]MCS1352749.1 hypothetical protein [Mechercharimyces sp. CAU 1602]